MIRVPRTLLACGLFLQVASSLPVSAATHPLEPLAAGEIRRAFTIVQAHFAAPANGLPSTGLFFPALWLEEPAKAVVQAWQPGQAFPRRARVEVMHRPSNRMWVASVDLEARRVVSLALQPPGTQGAVTADEFTVADTLVHEYAPWKAAMRARGVDPNLVYVDVWAPGDVELPAGVALSHGPKTRLLQALAFLRGGNPEDQTVEQPQNPYDRPVEGVVVTLDMNALRVVHMTDTLKRPVSGDSGNAVTPRPPLRPLVVTQRPGGSAHIADRRVRWQRWQFYPVLHPREGLVLYDVRYNDGGGPRRVAYRLSLSDIYVPYGVADPNWTWRTAFDVGEYNLGMYAQTLEPNRDVPENAAFLDAVLANDTGPNDDTATGSYDFPASIAIYERDAGALWTRTDPTTYARDTRFARELVVTWNAWIGNYIYAFDWIFRMDGSIAVEVHLTGTTLNRGGLDEAEPSAPAVGVDAAGVRTLAPVHQHFFNFRLDLDVDGSSNVVEESNVGPLDVPGFENAFGATEERLTTEGSRQVSPAQDRAWEVQSAGRRNAHGEPTAYEVHPGESATRSCGRSSRSTTSG
jgi:primary-amine oxidase